MVLDEHLTVAEEDRRLRLLLDRLPAIIGYWDRDLRNVIANDTYVTYFGLTGGEVCGFYCHAIDITARVEAERVRDEALRLFQLSMANAPIGETVLTAHGRAPMINPALCELIGATAEELAGRSYRDFVHPEDLPVAVEEHRSLVSGALSRISSEHRYIRTDGTVIWMQRTAVLAPGGEYGAEDVIITQLEDVTARKLAEAELARMAVTDQLTGCRTGTRWSTASRSIGPRTPRRRWASSSSISTASRRSTTSTGTPPAMPC
ncbi:MAG TPA: PAS domain S-box protein [Mycobacterium sp.]|nr:PAS domain S-box protein [Mycobacterium sp.]